MGVEKPTLLLQTYDTILYKLSEKVENEGNVMQGIEEKRQIAPPLLIGHVWIEGGQKFKKLLYEKHLGCR